MKTAVRVSDEGIGTGSGVSRFDLSLDLALTPIGQELQLTLISFRLAFLPFSFPAVIQIYSLPPPTPHDHSGPVVNPSIRFNSVTF